MNSPFIIIIVLKIRGGCLSIFFVRKAQPLPRSTTAYKGSRKKDTKGRRRYNSIINKQGYGSGGIRYIRSLNILRLQATYALIYY